MASEDNLQTRINRRRWIISRAASMLPLKGLALENRTRKNTPGLAITGKSIYPNKARIRWKLESRYSARLDSRRDGNNLSK